MTGAVRAGRLPSHRAEIALRPHGPAHRRSDARARPAPVAAAPPRATDVRPPADPACRHTRASRRGPSRSPRRVARRRAARADPGILSVKPGSTAASIRQTDASASHARRRPRLADRTCLWAIAQDETCRPSSAPPTQMGERRSRWIDRESGRPNTRGDRASRRIRTWHMKAHREPASRRLVRSRR